MAEKVMGLRTVSYRDDRALLGDDETYPHALPHFSTDIAAAWQVVEHLKEQANLTLYSTWQGWTAKFGGYSLEGEANDYETAPLAIVRAALAAIRP